MQDVRRPLIIAGAATGATVLIFGLVSLMPADSRAKSAGRVLAKILAIGLVVGLLEAFVPTTV